MSREELRGQKAGMQWGRKRITQCEQTGKHPDDLKRAADWANAHTPAEITAWFDEHSASDYSPLERLILLLCPSVESHPDDAREVREALSEPDFGPEFLLGFAQATAFSYATWQGIHEHNEGAKQKNIETNRRAIDRDPGAENN